MVVWRLPPIKIAYEPLTANQGRVSQSGQVWDGLANQNNRHGEDEGNWEEGRGSGDR